MADPVIRLSDAHLTLQGNAGPVPILRGLSLQVERGETVGLVGPSGSGKSSLLMLMGGLERATGGLVQAMGQDLTALDEDALARFRLSHMGVVFQSFHLIPTMTAHENVATPLELAGAPDAFDRAAAELDRVGLGARRDHYPAQLSGGEQRQAIMDLLFGLRADHGATLVLVTHDPDLARRCDRVIRLADGRLAAEAAA
ncbi:ABC transporter ATP-binding protein [Paracoccus sp. 08]|uniref:ABC transporter ATP-binding protein n=1 Tax=Paracoccus sp. 08 TaxID=2606624 RepID=UPI002094CECE|nr:ATP-binding cassette domain-containing protein [Paracoccus sp. 08]